MSPSRFGFASVVLAVPLLAACSDPVPPVPRAAWSVSFSSPNGQECHVAGHNAAIGEVDDNSKDTLVTDGTDGAEISCTVEGSSTYRVDASAYQNGKLLKMVIGGMTSNATEESPVTGTVAFASPNTINSYQSPAGGCDFYYVDGSKQGVGAGKIWVTFSCDTVTSGDSTCGIQRGYAIFENCATSSSSE